MRNGKKHGSPSGCDDSLLRKFFEQDGGFETAQDVAETTEMMNLLLDETGLPGDPNREEGLNSTMPERDSDDEGDYATALDEDFEIPDIAVEDPAPGGSGNCFCLFFTRVTRL